MALQSKKLSLATSIGLISYAQAVITTYRGDLSDCEAFAALFTSTTCNSVDTPWSDVASGIDSPDITCTGTDLHCIGGSSEQTSCSHAHKQCVTCQQDGNNVLIQVQTNSGPTHCYGTERDEDDTDTVYPVYQEIDYTVVFNEKVDTVDNYSSSDLTDEADVSAILCSSGNLGFSSVTGYSNAAAAISSDMVGLSFDNMQIHTAAGGSSDDFNNYMARMDTCLISKTSSGILNYKSISKCMKTASTTVAMEPLACEDDCDRVDLITSTISSGWSSTSNNGGYIGLARDGHTIIGPYNDDGELWSCDDHDICNGVFLNSYQYAYVSTTHFPYTMGCIGPAGIQYAQASCSSNTCGASAGVELVGATLLAFATLSALY